MHSCLLFNQQAVRAVILLLQLLLDNQPYLPVTNTTKHSVSLRQYDSRDMDTSYMSLVLVDAVPFCHVQSPKLPISGVCNIHNSAAGQPFASSHRTVVDCDASACFSSIDLISHLPQHRLTGWIGSLHVTDDSDDISPLRYCIC